MLVSFEKEFQINKEFLDTIDFIPFLKAKPPVLSVLMVAIETFIILNNKEMPPELEGNVFNYYNTDDFKEYLLERYPQLHLYPINDYLIGFRSNDNNDY